MKEKVMTSLFWKFLERFGSQFIQFVLQVVLARLLFPSDFGNFVIALVFIKISLGIIQNCFNTALVQKKEIDDLDLSSSLYFTMLISLFLYLLLFFIAPIISKLYGESILKPLIRVLGITLLFRSINVIYQAILIKDLKFKKLFYINLISLLLSCTSGIIIALKGYGVWALAYQQIINAFVSTAMFIIIIDFKPKLALSFTRAKVLFNFGSKLLVSSIIDSIYGSLYDLLIGKKYSSTSLGYYNRGKQLPDVIIQNFSNSVSQVIFPVLSKEQDNKERIKSIMRDSIRLSCYIVFPIAIGLMACAKSIIIVLFSTKWIKSVLYLQIASVIYMFWPVHAINLQAINSIGRSDIFLKLEVIKKVLGIFIILVTLNMSLKWILFGLVIVSFLSLFINMFPNKKLFNYTIINQLVDMFSSFVLAVIMGVLVYLIGLVKLNVVLLLLIQVFSGIIIYLLLSILFKNDSFRYLKNSILRIYIKKKAC